MERAHQSPYLWVITIILMSVKFMCLKIHPNVWPWNISWFPSIYLLNFWFEFYSFSCFCLFFACIICSFGVCVNQSDSPGLNLAYTGQQDTFAVKNWLVTISLSPMIEHGMGQNWPDIFAVTDQLTLRTLICKCNYPLSAEYTKRGGRISFDGKTEATFVTIMCALK